MPRTTKRYNNNGLLPENNATTTPAITCFFRRRAENDLQDLKEGESFAKQSNGVVPRGEGASDDGISHKMVFEASEASESRCKSESPISNKREEEADVQQSQESNDRLSTDNEAWIGETRLRTAEMNASPQQQSEGIRSQSEHPHFPTSEYIDEDTRSGAMYCPSPDKEPAIIKCSSPCNLVDGRASSHIGTPDHHLNSTEPRPTDGDALAGGYALDLRHHQTDSSCQLRGYAADQTIMQEALGDHTNTSGVASLKDIRCNVRKRRQSFHGFVAFQSPAKPRTHYTKPQPATPPCFPDLEGPERADGPSKNQIELGVECGQNRSAHDPGTSSRPLPGSLNVMATCNKDQLRQAVPKTPPPIGRHPESRRNTGRSMSTGFAASPFNRSALAMIHETKRRRILTTPAITSSSNDSIATASIEVPKSAESYGKTEGGGLLALENKATSNSVKNNRQNYHETKFERGSNDKEERYLVSEMEGGVQETSDLVVSHSSESPQNRITVGTPRRRVSAPANCGDDDESGSETATRSLLATLDDGVIAHETRDRKSFRDLRNATRMRRLSAPSTLAIEDTQCRQEMTGLRVLRQSIQQVRDQAGDCSLDNRTDNRSHNKKTKSCWNRFMEEVERVSSVSLPADTACPSSTPIAEFWPSQLASDEATRASAQFVIIQRTEPVLFGEAKKVPVKVFYQPPNLAKKNRK